MTYVRFQDPSAPRKIIPLSVTNRLPDDRYNWDILRPNRAAVALTSRHLKALEALGDFSIRKIAVQ